MTIRKLIVIFFSVFRRISFFLVMMKSSNYKGGIKMERMKFVFSIMGVPFGAMLILVLLGSFFH
jgi:hypothetical protein